MKMKMFNYSELHFSEGTSFKIHTLDIETEIHGLEFIHLGLCFKNTNNPMWQKGSSRVTEGN